MIPAPAPRIARWFALALMTSLACGCQALPRPDVSGKPEPAVSASTANPPRWGGRLALTVHSEPAQSWSAGFELQGNAHAGRLHVLSPLGSVVSLLSWSPEQAVLRAGDKTVAYPSLADLTQAATGTALPIEALLDWLAGRPTAAAGWQVDLSRHAQGRISATRTQPEPRAELRVVLDSEEKTGD